MPRIRAARTRRLFAAIEARHLGTPSLRLLAIGMLAIDLALFAWTLANGGSILSSQGRPNTIDFSFIYAGGAAAASRHAASVYDYSAFVQAQAALFAPPAGGLPYFHFLYPPVFLLFAYPLALLPVVSAFAAWLVVTALLYLASLRLIVERGALLLPAAIGFAPLKNAQLGQNGFLTAGLVGLALALLERQPVAAGVCVGLLVYKPQFGVLFPLALAAAGRWRAIAAAAATVVVLAILARLVLGHDIWPAYLDSLRGFDARLSPDQHVTFQYQSVFGLLKSLGASLAVAWTAQLAAAILAAGLIGTLWYRTTPYALQAAALCVGAVAVTPYVLTYDLCILAVAVAFLVRDAAARGTVVGERVLLLLFFAASLLLTRPVGPLLYAMLLAAVLWRLTALQGAPAIAATDAAGEPPRAGSTGPRWAAAAK